MEHNITSHSHSICQISVNLVEDVFRRTSEEDGAGFGVFALGKEGEVFVANLLDLEKSAGSSYIGVLEILDSVDDCCASGSGDSVGIGLADSAESSNIGLQKVMLSEV